MHVLYCAAVLCLFSDCSFLLFLPSSYLFILLSSRQQSFTFLPPALFHHFSPSPPSSRPCVLSLLACLVFPPIPPSRIFVVGIGFFSLCFLMTSLGGQFSAKRLGDSPFTIRTEGRENTLFVCVSACGSLALSK